MNLVLFWSIAANEVLQQLKSSPTGLTSPEVKIRLKLYRPNLLKPKKKSTALMLLLSQFQSPIIILIFAAGLSFFLNATTDALIILMIVWIIGLLGFWQFLSQCSL